MAESKKVLVTGGSGFIGTHVCRRLVQDGHKVRALDLVYPRSPVETVQYLKGDVRDRDLLGDLIRDTDAVYHFAAMVSVPLCQKQPMESYLTNLIGTCNVLDAIHREQIKNNHPIRLIFAASSAAYGHVGQCEKPISESEVSKEPLSFYAAQKLGSEQLIRIFHKVHGLAAVVFRFFNVYGPGQDQSSPYSGVISLFCSSISSGAPLTLYGDGLQTRDFISVHDVAQANLNALYLPIEKCTAEAMNLGTSQSTSIRKLAQTLTHLLGKKVPILSSPAREGDVRFSMANIEKARRELQWEPQITLESGLSELLEHLRIKTLPHSV